MTQEVFLVVMRALPQYRTERGSFRSWLWTITRNKIIDRRKSPAKRSIGIGGSSFLRQLAEVEQADEVDLPLDEPSDPLGQHALIRRGLEQVRVEFQSKTWAAFWRTTIDGLSPDVVAGELAMTNVAVRQAKSRVLRRLREQLGESD